MVETGASMASLRDQVRVGDVFDRDNVLHFVGLMRRASEEERQELAPIAEAFSVLASTPEEIVWLAEALSHANDDMPALATLDSLEARLERLDARKVKQAPGQLGLDLTGGPGIPCGESFISRDKECHKGQGEEAPRPTAAGQPEDQPPASPAGKKGNPRATASTMESSGDYAFARPSTVQNAGEDLALSARHRRNMFRTLEEAEANGDASATLTRDNLLKAFPSDLVSTINPANTLSHLQSYLMLQAFPQRPASDKDLARYHAAAERLRSRGGGFAEKSDEELRRQYHDAFQDFHKLVHQVAQDPDPISGIKAARDWVSTRIREIRGSSSLGDFTARDPYNPVANSLVNLSNRLSGRGSTSVRGRMNEFAEKLKMASGGQFATPAETLAKAQEYATRIIEGESFNEAFGTVGQGGKRRFNAADLYVAPAKREGGRVVGGDTVESGTAFVLNQAQFRGLQYGNSVTDDERRHHLRKAAEALADLADMTGLPDGAMGLRGTLGLAIGARGHGTALAHYEPGLKVINLTRKRGVGTLAHEWGHALDNYLVEGAGQEGMTRLQKALGSGRFLSQRYVRPDDTDPVKRAMEEVSQLVKSSGFRPRLMRTIHEMRREGYALNADYWASHEEVFARSFECHIQHKLREAGRLNTYLAQPTNHPLWPTEEESRQMAPAFETLLAAVRSKHFADMPIRRDSRSVRVDRFMAQLQQQDAARHDAAEAAAEDEEPIDWERVNREAQSIVELNQAARQRWKEQQGQEEGQED